MRTVSSRNQSAPVSQPLSYIHNFSSPQTNTELRSSSWVIDSAPWSWIRNKVKTEHGENNTFLDQRKKPLQVAPGCRHLVQYDGGILTKKKHGEEKKQRKRNEKRKKETLLTLFRGSSVVCRECPRTFRRW